MTVNNRKLSQTEILARAINSVNKPVGKVTDNGRAIIRYDKVLVIQDQHQTVAATTCQSNTEAKRTMACFQ